MSPVHFLEDWTVGCPETSVKNYKLTLRNNPESEDLIYNTAEAKNLGNRLIDTQQRSFRGNIREQQANGQKGTVTRSEVRGCNIIGFKHVCFY
jgi:hypothetical protein